MFCFLKYNNIFVILIQNSVENMGVNLVHEVGTFGDHSVNVGGQTS